MGIPDDADQCSGAYRSPVPGDRDSPECFPRILTSQLPVSRWHEQIGDPTLADGILDRLVHNAHRIEMRGGLDA